MAATSISLHLRPHRHRLLPLLRHRNPNSLSFSSNSTDSPPPPPQSPSEYPPQQSSFSSYFRDIKSKLKQPQPQPPPPLSNLGAVGVTPKTASESEILKNLQEFRLRSSPPPPSGTVSNLSSAETDSSAPTASFMELYKRNADMAKFSEDIEQKRTKSIADIRERLRNLPRDTVGNKNVGVGDEGTASLSSFDKIKSSLKKDESGSGVQRKPGIFDMVKKPGGMSGESYSYLGLGEKLKHLRPDVKGKTNWFTLGELNKRLKKMREIEEKESAKLGGVRARELKGIIGQLKESEAEKKVKKSPVIRHDMSNLIGGTASFMTSLPKEQLIETYFHPDNMSSAEKLKLELKKVRDEFKMSESDCGSARVQVAQLTTKIKHLSANLHKKDKHSRKGLQGMVQQRKKLLKYLRRTDWDSYCMVLSKLGLRDNPDYKN